MSRKIISLFLCLSFLFQQTSFAQVATAELNLANYFARMGSSLAVDKFRPLHLRYFSYDTLNNDFKLLLDKGDFVKGLSPKGTVPEQELKEEAKTLLSYFLVGVTLPNDTFWVNLRPDSEDRIIDTALAQTDVGKVMLEADLQLKKDTARFTSPQTPEGREYWNKLYKKAEEIYGYENITIPTITRPWIVPGEIIVRESQDSAYVYKAVLKVMLEQDYLKDSAAYEFKDIRSKALNEYSSQLIRELILPKLTKEVNSSKRYAPLRQVYYSLILSRWFKLRFADKKGLSPTTKGSPERVSSGDFSRGKGTVPVFIDRINTQNLTGLTSKESWSKVTYFEQYKKSFAVGEYNIKEPVYTPTGQVIRSYFSGGVEMRFADSPISKVVIPAEFPTERLSKFGILMYGDPSGQLFTAFPITTVNKSRKAEIGTRTAGSPMQNRARVVGKLEELKKNSGLPISMAISDIPIEASDNVLWAQTLRALSFDTPIYRRVERESRSEERYTGVTAFTSANEGIDTDIDPVPNYDVSGGKFKSVRMGEDVRNFISQEKASIPQYAYFMHRGIFASRADIQKAFYDNKIRFDITVIPPAIWGVDFAKTVGHYHDPVDYPEVYQVVSGEVLWVMQKSKNFRDPNSEIIEVITVKAKAGDIAIMLPGYGHVSVNLSETEPLVMANWLTWHQSSYYGSFKDNKGAAYYVIKNDEGKPELRFNSAYKQDPPPVRQMVAKDEIPEFGLTRGVPIYNLVKLVDREFSQKVEFLYHPEQYSGHLTPGNTLDRAKPKDIIKVSVSSAMETQEEMGEADSFISEMADKDKFIDKLVDSITELRLLGKENGASVRFLIYGNIGIIELVAPANAVSVRDRLLDLTQSANAEKLGIIAVETKGFPFNFIIEMDTFNNIRSKVLAVGASPLQDSETAEQGSKASSAVQAVEPVENPGGIDFRGLPVAIQPMGSFSGLNFTLPKLSQADLKAIDIDSELGQIQRMASSGVRPSGERVKELIAACVQKGKINYYVDNFLLCLIDICKLEEENAYESSTELREALVIVDSVSWTL